MQTLPKHFLSVIKGKGHFIYFSTYVGCIKFQLSIYLLKPKVEHDISCNLLYLNTFTLNRVCKSLAAPEILSIINIYLIYYNQWFKMPLL